MNKPDAAFIDKAITHAKKILVIKMKYVGDSVWALPFFDNLKQNNPHAFISVVAFKGSEDLFNNCAAVDSVIIFSDKESDNIFKKISNIFKFLLKLRQVKPDVAIDATESNRSALFSYISGARQRTTYAGHNKWRTRLFTVKIKPPDKQLHLVDCHFDYLKKLGLNIFDQKIKVDLNPQAHHSLLNKFPGLETHKDDRKKIIIHPGARIELRQWGAANFARLADILNKSFRVFLVAGPNEAQLLSQISGQMKSRPEICSSNLSIMEFSELCRVADLFIGNDSGPIHIASANTFVVGIYGPNTDSVSGPWCEKKYIFEPIGLDCRPCVQTTCSDVVTKACLKQIDPEKVAQKATELLSDVCYQ